MLQAVSLTFFFYLLQQLPLSFHEPDVPILVFLPPLEGPGQLLEETQGSKRTAPEPARMITVEELGGVLIPVIRCLVQPVQCPWDILGGLLPK